MNWLFNDVTINEISVIYMTAHIYAGGRKRQTIFTYEARVVAVSRIYTFFGKMCLDGHVKEPYEMYMALGAKP